VVTKLAHDLRAWFCAVRWTFLRFLFERPHRFRIAAGKPLILAPAQ
jgi:hypothetical protein